jgi:hypothetical protein
MNNHRDIVFTYGALRSGTTVFRLMLDAHPKISNPGEMDFLFDHITLDNSHPTGWRYDIDALQDDRIFRATGLTPPIGLVGLDLLDDFLAQLKARESAEVVSINLHRHIGKVLQIMPDVRVLHMLRDPRDVARSSIQMGWAGTLYHGVGHWIETERDWDSGTSNIRPEQTLEITYEGLFRDIDMTLHAVCDFFDVPFDPDMLRYHENTTYGPPDVSLTEQWKRKCAPAELEELESRAGDLMQARGYALSQPAIQLSSLRMARLVLRDTLYKWQFGMARYGAALYWAEKLTRWAGLKNAHRRYRHQIQQIVTKNLK